MERLKLILVAAVLLLGVAVVYGYVDDDGDQPAETSSTVAETPPEATPATLPSADTEKEEARPRGQSRVGQQREVSEAPQGAKEPAASANSAASKAAFVRQAEKICAQMPARFAQRTRQMQAAGEVSGAPEDVVSRVVPPVLLETARAFAGLDPPDGAADDAAAMVAALEAGARLVRRDPAVGLESESRFLGDFGKLARRNGLLRCSQI